jgi:hypothetical protein
MKLVALLLWLFMACGCCSHKHYHPAVREF